MKRGKGKISDLLHEMFSIEAIKCCALIEMLEDTKYLIQHDILDDDSKQKQMYDECEALELKDNRKTLNDVNVVKFRTKVNLILSKNKNMRLYDGLTETEQFAVRRLYYPSH